MYEFTNVNNVRGNVYLKTLVFRQEKSRLCRTSFSNRVLHLLLTDNRYVLTTVLSLISTNLDNFIHPIHNHNFCSLQDYQQSNYVSHSLTHNILLYLRSTYLPTLHERTLQFNRSITQNFLANSPFITTNITTHMDGYMVHSISMPSKDENGLISKHSLFTRTKYATGLYSL